MDNRLVRIYKPEELKAMNYIFSKDENNKEFTEFELKAINKINLLDEKVVNICKTIWDNKDNEKILNMFYNQLNNELNQRREDKYMNNKLMIFKNDNFGEIRSLEINGEPWFVGKEIAKILGYQNGSRDINRHVDKEDVKSDVAIYDGSQTRYVTMINESGLYSLIMSSKLPKAKLFKRWVTSEVLPSIRKNGSYELDTNDLMKQLTESQITLNNVLAGFKMQIDNDLTATNNKLAEHDELLKTRIYLSPSEAKNVQDAIKAKAKQIAIENDLPYKIVRPKLFARLYIALKDKFEVATYRELPSFYYSDVMEAIPGLAIGIRDIQNEVYQMSI